MQFNLEFIITLIIALYVAYLVNHGSPNLNPYITFLLLPLAIAYLVVVIINNVLPGLNRWGRNVYRYGEDVALSEINDTGYIQLFPPLFIVLVIFVVLLYNRMLG
jgi:hypothetical protein